MIEKYALTTHNVFWFVYVFGLENGITKIGVTQNPESRIMGIKAFAAKTFHSKILNRYVSPPLQVIDARKVEKLSLSSALLVGVNFAKEKEFFRDLSFKTAVSIVQKHTFSVWLAREQRIENFLLEVKKEPLLIDFFLKIVKTGKQETVSYDIGVKLMQMHKRLKGEK